MTLTELITTIRAMSNDALDNKVIFAEQIGGSDTPSFPVDGSNKMFRLKQVPLSDVSGLTGEAQYAWLTIRGTGSVVRTHAGFKVLDQENGIIEFTTAPNPGNVNPTDGVYFDYNYVWFTDAKYTEFLNQAAQMTLAGVAGPASMVAGLTPAMLHYALGSFWRARASLFAEQYESHGGDAGEQVQTVTQAYLALAASSEKRADFLKQDYYKAQGQRESPAAQDVGVNFDPITPIR